MRQLLPRELAAHCAASPSLLLDVREPWEVALAAIRLPGAAEVQIPLGQLAARLGELDRARSIVCVCHHGVRSLQAVAFLTHHGFESVYNLAGGIDAWSTHVDAGVPRY
jgi:rhodanese-related sulfurtransferase